MGCNDRQRGKLYFAFVHCSTDIFWKIAIRHGLLFIIHQTNNTEYGNAPVKAYEQLVVFQLSLELKFDAKLILDQFWPSVVPEVSVGSIK